jgi:hypothetical protein
MPGEPGPRHTGGAPHASDHPSHVAGDTPYDAAVSLPMTSRTVGVGSYLQVNNETGSVNTWIR